MRPINDLKVTCFIIAESWSAEQLLELCQNSLWALLQVNGQNQGPAPPVVVEK